MKGFLRHRKLSLLFIFFIQFGVLCSGLFAQIKIVAENPASGEVAVGGTYVQDFDSLPANGSGTWTDNSTLLGWYANLTSGQVSTGNMVATTLNSISAVAVGATGGASTLNSLGTSGSSNRALGGTPSAYTTGSAGIFSSKSVNVVLRVKNSTGGALTGMKVAYDTIATATSNKDAVAFAYKIFSAGSGTISANFIETHEYLNTYNGTYNESMRTEYGRRVSSTSGWTCVVKDIAPTSGSNRVDQLAFALKDLALNPGDEIWLAWHIAKENEQGSSDAITTTAIDNVTLSDFTVGRPGIPVITTHPRNLSIATGLSRGATLSVVAKGASTLSYQWRKDGVNLAGATSSSYALSNVTSAVEGMYDVVVSSSSGSVTSLPAKVNTYAKVAVTSVLDVSYAAYSSSISNLAAASGGTLCDLYYPTSLASGSAKVPAIVVIHGGGGNNGDKADGREVEAAQELAARGWFVMVINYAMSSSTTQCWPYNLWDAKQAIRWLKQKADAGTYKIDKTKIGVCGFSWGCNMGSMLAMTGASDDIGVSSSSLKVEPPTRTGTSAAYDAYSTDVQCSAVWYGAADLPNYHQMNQFLSYTAWDNRTLYRRASPIRYPNKNAAPMLIAHGSADDDVWPNQTESTYHMQRSQGAKLEPYLLVPGGQHSFGLYETTKIQTGFPNPIDVRPETLGFFEKYLIETSERPAIQVEPVGKIANEGSLVSFAVEASGSPAPTYQWRKNGVNLSGATSSTYQVSASTSLAGYYDVVVSNSAGAVTSSSALLSVAGVVSPVAPVANPDLANIVFNSPTSIDVLLNDSDANGDPLTITAVTQGAHGTVVFIGSSVTYTPTLDYSGGDTFTYTISDGQGGESIGLVTVSIVPNEAPKANTDTVVTGINLTKVISVLANDTDTNNDPLSIVAVTQGAKGSVTFTSSNVTYTPNSSYIGVDSFTYTVSDGKGGTSIGTVNLSIEGNLTLTVSAEATVESGTNASANIDEATLLYVTTKFSSAVTSSRKAYFQFNLGTANVNATSSATFTIYFKNSFTQRVQLWALNQEYSAFSSSATWSTAQANDTLSNGMLTTGVATATAIGSSVMLQPGASPYTPATFTIPSIGSYLKGGKVTLVLTGLDVTAADTTALLVNSTSGARYTLGTASLRVPLNNGANTPPTISSIANRTLSEDKLPNLISFTILDGQTPPENLVISFQSNHPEKIPVENIVLGGAGSNRTIQITPLPNSNGSTNIKVLVSDPEGAIATESFDISLTAVNDAPTLSDILDQVMDANTTRSAIPFVVADVDNDPATLIVSASSSDQALIPNSGLLISGVSSERALGITPSPNQIGTCTITVTVTDGVLSASDTFTVTVNPANTRPSISDVLDQSMAIDAVGGPWTFTVADIETSTTALQVSASSSNQALLPDSGILLSGEGVDRSIRVSPISGQFGQTIITVTVSDGVLSASDTFTVTVNPANTRPSISDVLDQSMAIDTVGGPWTFTVADIETSTTALQVSASSSNQALLPDSGILLTGEGVDRSIHVSPISGQFGQTVITITVSDGSLMSSDSFVLRVAPSFASLFAGKGATSDEDQDGVCALVEYGLGGSPLSNDSGKLPQPTVQGEYLVMTVVERTNDSALLIRAESSAGVTFSSLGATPVRAVSIDQDSVPPGFARVTYSIPIAGNPTQFMRLRFEVNP